MFQHALVNAKLTAGTQEIYLAEDIFTNLEKVKIILVLDIALTVYLDPALQPFVGQVIAGVQTFEKDGMIIFQQLLQHLFRSPAGNDVWLEAHGRLHSDLTLVIVNFFAILVQFLTSVATGILNAVQVDLYTLFIQGLDLVEYIDHSTVIGGVRNIERNNMQMLILQDARKFGLIFAPHSPSKAVQMQI